MKRKVEILIISDTHLGTFGAQAKKLLLYLESIQPEMVIINGDLIDIWQFLRLYFPKSHLRVLQHLSKWAAAGIPTYYLTGNHDDLLRRFTPMILGNFQLQDEIELLIGNQKILIFHGDIYDKSIKARFPAIMGGFAYHVLVVMDRMFNAFTGLFGIRRIRISKTLKDFSKTMAKKIGNFEDEAINVAIERQYDILICGHIHKPQKRVVQTEKGSVLYLNSGDWVENATSLEYNNEQWNLFEFDEQ